MLVQKDIQIKKLKSLNNQKENLDTISINSEEVLDEDEKE